MVRNLEEMLGPLPSEWEKIWKENVRMADERREKMYETKSSTGSLSVYSPVKSNWLDQAEEVPALEDAEYSKTTKPVQPQQIGAAGYRDEDAVVFEAIGPEWSPRPNAGMPVRSVIVSAKGPDLQTSKSMEELRELWEAHGLTEEEPLPEPIPLPERIKEIGKLNKWQSLDPVVKKELLIKLYQGHMFKDDLSMSLIQIETLRAGPKPLSVEEASAFEDLLSQMLRYDPTERIPLDSILDQRWFNEEYPIDLTERFLEPYDLETTHAFR